MSEREREREKLCKKTIKEDVVYCTRERKCVNARKMRKPVL
jgi:phosphosulfolactate phosphohydrolase-like enzyme